MAFDEHMEFADALCIQGNHRLFDPFSPNAFGLNRQVIQITAPASKLRPYQAVGNNRGRSRTD